MLLPAGLELVERWVMWRDGVRDQERKDTSEGRQRYSVLHSGLSCSTSRGLW